MHSAFTSPFAPPFASWVRGAASLAHNRPSSLPARHRPSRRARLIAAAADTGATHAPASAHAHASASQPVPRTQCLVALTREADKNPTLAERLAQLGIPTVDLPCIEHADGPDLPSLAPHLASSASQYLYILITSPESAHVLLSTLVASGIPPSALSPIAAVGDATFVLLASAGYTPAFVPSKATGATLVAELPIPLNTPFKTALYPASSLAPSDIQDALAARGVTVTRLNTYTTRAATWPTEAAEVAASVRVVTFASPSAVKAWKANTAGVVVPGRKWVAACIGETSAKACRSEGWESDRVFAAEKPGMDGWVSAVVDAVAACEENE